MSVRIEFGYWVFTGEDQPAQRPSWNYRKEDGGGIIVGLLGYIGLWVVMLILLATVVGFPFGIFVFRVFKWLGIAGIFFAVGRRVGRSMGREMSLLGAVLLVFLPFVAIQIAPLLFGPFGWISRIIVRCSVTAYGCAARSVPFRP